MHNLSMLAKKLVDTVGVPFAILSAERKSPQKNNQHGALSSLDHGICDCFKFASQGKEIEAYLMRQIWKEMADANNYNSAEDKKEELKINHDVQRLFLICLQFNQGEGNKVYSVNKNIEEVWLSERTTTF